MPAERPATTTLRSRKTNVTLNFVRKNMSMATCKLCKTIPRATVATRSRSPFYCGCCHLPSFFLVPDGTPSGHGPQVNITVEKVACHCLHASCVSSIVPCHSWPCSFDLPAPAAKFSHGMTMGMLQQEEAFFLHNVRIVCLGYTLYFTDEGRRKPLD